MKKLVLFAAAAVFSLGLALGAAQATDAPADGLKVTNYGKKPAVTFDHSKHTNQLKCEECHHKAGEGKYKCGECHKAKAEGDKPKLKDAAHKKEVGKCWGCHRAKNAKKKLKCNDCHKG
ncbi:MAG: class III cytochrome c [Candidatus Dadabacteria bacterium]|nr:MAG: class III cytochrome c [Candidatus Dadabacteria bacterium]